MHNIQQRYQLPLSYALLTTVLLNEEEMHYLRYCSTVLQ